MLAEFKKYNKNALRAAATFSNNIGVCVFDKKVKKGPLFISWDIAGACNARCIMCNRWQSRKEELSTDDKIKITKKIGDSRVWLLSLCGGEPFLMKDLKEVLLAARQSGLLTNITTNGSLLRESLDLMKHFDFLTVSIDSHIPDLHDLWRGKKGLFDSALTSINEIMSLSKRPFVSVRQVLNKTNLMSADDYIRFWKDKVDEVLFQPIHQCAEVGYSIPENFIPDAFDDAEATAYFNQTLKRHRMMNEYTAGICGFLFDEKRKQANYTCYSGFFALEMDHQGNLFNCAKHLYKIGNLKDDDMLTLLNSKKDDLKKISDQKQCVCHFNCEMVNIYINKLVKLLKVVKG